MRNRRCGIALFVCLVVLLTLGVAGVSASQTVSLEVRMARNGHDGDLALQAAESALREGEQLVASAGFDPATPGLYAKPGFGAPVPWSRPETWEGGDSRVATTLPGVAAPPRFIVERIASWVDPEGGFDVEVLRVTARAGGRYAARPRDAADHFGGVASRRRVETRGPVVLAGTRRALRNASRACDRAASRILDDAVAVTVPRVPDTGLGVDHDLSRKPRICALGAIEEVAVLPVRQSVRPDQEVGPVAEGTPVEPVAFLQARHAAQEHVLAVEAPVGVPVEEYQRAVVPGVAPSAGGVRHGWTQCDGCAVRDRGMAGEADRAEHLVDRCAGAMLLDQDGCTAAGGGDEYARHGQRREQLHQREPLRISQPSCLTHGRWAWNVRDRGRR